MSDAVDRGSSRSGSAAGALAEAGATVAGSPAEVAAACEVTVSCVTDSAAAGSGKLATA